MPFFRGVYMVNGKKFANFWILPLTPGWEFETLILRSVEPVGRYQNSRTHPFPDN